MNPELRYFTPFRVASAVRVAAAAVIASITLSVHADHVYQCKDVAGKVTYSNVPCNGQGVAPDPASEGAPRNTYIGEWRGQTQFRQTVAGQAAGTAHVVAPMTLAIDPGGRVTVGSTEPGCRALGLVMPCQRSPYRSQSVIGVKEPGEDRRIGAS